MMAGLVLILLAFILILVGILLVFQILPRFVFGLKGAGAPAEGNIDLDPKVDPGIPQVPPMVRNGVLGFCGLVSLILVVAGVVLIFRDQSHDFAVQDVLRENQDLLAKLASTPLATAPAQTSSPSPVGTLAPSPTGTRTPSTTPTKAPGTTGGRPTFNDAVQLDQAGENLRAIETYKVALSEGLDPAAKQAAELEIGLLSLLQVRDGDLSACKDALTYLKPLSTSATDKSTRSSASDGYKLADDLCP